MGQEEIVYKAVLAGELTIDESGAIWRVASRRGLRWEAGTRLVPCERRRAEHRLPTGYLQVRAMYSGKRANALAHRVVWRHFNGPIPDGLTVNHRNGVKDDNRPANLELATYAEQTAHTVETLGRHGTLSQRGERNHRAKLTDMQVTEIRRRRASGEQLAAIARDFGVTMQTISKIARGERR